ncbi:hypothetical protein [Curtobacterium sp. MWU13-2055]|uniref:hypothetical protein n=1 Tax=Curtobacterium sp. MWU13-2055 TaxID=2931928 RepID=UPI00200DAE0C|nr:hypothetical protein [Curtobacterium sp. MWU13-2055]
MSITLTRNGVPAHHTIDVRHGGDATDGVVRARLYVDGTLTLVSRVPARFPVTGGHIEVRVSEAGLRRCHFVAEDGTQRQLVPDPRSAEGRRLRFAQRHPAASRIIGAVSVVVLLVGVGLNVLQVLEPISEIPPIADTVDTFESPVHLTPWANVALGFAAALGAVERATRLRYHWLLDGGAAS